MCISKGRDTLLIPWALHIIIRTEGAPRGPMTDETSKRSFRPPLMTKNEHILSSCVLKVNWDPPLVTKKCVHSEVSGGGAKLRKPQGLPSQTESCPRIPSKALPTAGWLWPSSYKKSLNELTGTGDCDELKNN